MLFIVAALVVFGIGICDSHFVARLGTSCYQLLGGLV